MLCEGLLTVSPRTVTHVFADVEVPSNDYEQIPGFASLSSTYEAVPTMH
jgi:hypothetical protein